MAVSRRTSDDQRGLRTLTPLVSYELRRALRHPAFLAAMATVIAAWMLPWLLDRSVLDLTVVNVDAMSIQVPLLLPAAGAFLGAALIGLADYRFAADEMLSVMPVSSRARLVAQAAAAVGPAAAVLLLTAARLGVVSAAAGAGGRPPLVGDVLTPMVLTGFAAVLGTCCAHLWRSLAACGAVLAGLGILTVVGAFAAYGTGARGLMPIMMVNPIGEPPVPTPLLTRPAGLHVVWIVALAAVVLLATILRRHPDGRRLVGAGLTVALLVAAGAGAAQVGRDRGSADPDAAWSALYQRPRAAQRCTDIGPDRYCAFPAFASRIPYWREVVAAQKGLLPASVAGTAITVRQRLSPEQSRSGGTPPSLPWQAWQEDDAVEGSAPKIPVSTRWARPDSDDYAQNDVLAFSVLTAATLVGWTMPTDAVPRHGEVCGARGVVTAWLATQSSPVVSSAYRQVKAHTSGPGLLQASILGADTVVVGEREVAVAEALAGRPRDQVATAVRERWSELSAASTSVDRAATLLGVSAPQTEPVTVVCTSPR